MGRDDPRIMHDVSTRSAGLYNTLFWCIHTQFNIKLAPQHGYCYKTIKRIFETATKNPPLKLAIQYLFATQMSVRGRYGSNRPRDKQVGQVGTIYSAAIWDNKAQLELSTIRPTYFTPRFGKHFAGLKYSLRAKYVDKETRL